MFGIGNVDGVLDLCRKWDESGWRGRPCWKSQRGGLSFAGSCISLQANFYISLWFLQLCHRNRELCNVRDSMCFLLKRKYLVECHEALFQKRKTKQLTAVFREDHEAVLLAGAERLVPRGHGSEPLSITETAVQWAATILLSRSFSLNLQNQVHTSFHAVFGYNRCSRPLRFKFLQRACFIHQRDLSEEAGRKFCRRDSCTRPVGRYAEP